MSECTKQKCKRWCVRCFVAAAFFNNTPLGFLGEHLFWEKIPYFWYLPAMLGIH